MPGHIILPVYRWYKVGSNSIIAKSCQHLQLCKFPVFYLVVAIFVFLTLALCNNYSDLPCLNLLCIPVFDLVLTSILDCGSNLLLNLLRMNPHMSSASCPFLFQQGVMDHICILGTDNTDVVTVVSGELWFSWPVRTQCGCSLNQSQIHAWRDTVRPHRDFHTFLPNIAYCMDYLNSKLQHTLSSACIKLYLHHGLLDRQYFTLFFEVQQSGLIMNFQQLDIVI